MRRLLRLVRFLGFFAVELVRSNLQVAREVLSPRHTMHAAVLPVSIRATTDLEVSALSGLIALTPGTLPVDIDRERGVLLLHVLHAPTTEEIRGQIRDLEDRLLGVLR